MNLGQTIKMCRSRRGLTQAELAKRAEFSVSYLSLLENNERDPSLSTLQRIAIALDVPISILFFLAAERGELAGLGEDLAGRLAKTALEFLSAPEREPTLL